MNKVKVILIALNLKIVLKGERTWSWYMPTITSGLYFVLKIKAVSGDIGPLTLILIFLIFFIAGSIIFFYSVFFKAEKLCGFKPKTAIEGFLLIIFL